MVLPTHSLHQSPDLLPEILLISESQNDMIKEVNILNVNPVDRLRLTKSPFGVRHIRGPAGLADLGVILQGWAFSENEQGHH